MSVSQTLSELGSTFPHTHFTLDLYLFYLLSFNKPYFQIKIYLL